MKLLLVVFALCVGKVTCLTCYYCSNSFDSDCRTTTCELKENIKTENICFKTFYTNKDNRTVYQKGCEVFGSTTLLTPNKAKDQCTSSVNNGVNTTKCICTSIYCNSAPKFTMSIITVFFSNLFLVYLFL